MAHHYERRSIIEMEAEAVIGSGAVVDHETGSR